MKLSSLSWKYGRYLSPAGILYRHHAPSKQKNGNKIKEGGI
jgi:hypothetical protein